MRAGMIYPLTDWRFHVQVTDLTNVPNGKSFIYPVMQVELSSCFVIKFKNSNSTQIEDIKEIVEKKFKVRML